MDAVGSVQRCRGQFPAYDGKLVGDGVAHHAGDADFIDVTFEIAEPQELGRVLGVDKASDHEGDANVLGVIDDPSL